MTARVAGLVWLVVVWVALWEDVSVANVAGGVVVGALLLAAFPHVDGMGPGPPRIRPLGVLRFLLAFFEKLVEANLVVAWEVLTPNNEGVNEGVVAVPLETSSPLIVTTLANAISLTPGTLVIEVQREPSVLYVHVLHLRSIDQVRVDVLRLERLLLRAAGSPEEVRALDVRRAELEAGMTGDGGAT